MIPHGVEIFMAIQPIDLRWGFDRLAGLVGDALGRDARGGALFECCGHGGHFRGSARFPDARAAPAFIHRVSKLFVIPDEPKCSATLS